MVGGTLGYVGGWYSKLWGWVVQLCYNNSGWWMVHGTLGQGDGRYTKQVRVVVGVMRVHKVMVV